MSTDRDTTLGGIEERIAAHVVARPVSGSIRGSTTGSRLGPGQGQDSNKVGPKTGLGHLPSSISPQEDLISAISNARHAPPYTWPSLSLIDVAQPESNRCGPA